MTALWVSTLLCDIAPRLIHKKRHNKFDSPRLPPLSTHMNDPFFFGYGSLVNRATHIYADAHPARLHGWRRCWRPTGRRPWPFLSVEQHENSTIEGLIARVPNADWEALDERELAYDRHKVTTLDHPLEGEPDTATYVVPTQNVIEDPSVAILLSYLDVVVQGYLKEFGEAGVRRFFETTTGWDRPVKNDRADPIYPRHQKLSATETELVESELTRLGISV